MEKLDIFNILFWILILIAIILLIWYMFGKTPGTESLVAALIASELALWKLMYKHGREFSMVKGSFQLVRKDIDVIRKDINTMGKNINSDLGLIKKKLKIKN